MTDTAIKPRPGLDSTSFKILLWANIIMVLMIVIHDSDHVRQAHHWCYTIGPDLMLVNVLVYMPSAIALLLAFRRHRLAAHFTVVNGLFVAIGFAQVHLWRPAIPVWGIWNTNFFHLNVDATSWIILAITVLVGVAVAMAGTYVAGRLSALSTST